MHTVEIIYNGDGTVDIETEDGTIYKNVRIESVRINSDSGVVEISDE